MLGGWLRLGIFISALWTVSIITFSIYEHSTLNDDIYLNDLKPFIFWKWKIKNAEVSGENIWDKAAKEKGFKTWNEILLNPRFQKLSAEEKEEARNAYWKDISIQTREISVEELLKQDIIAFEPNDEKRQVREQFDKYTTKALPLDLDLQIIKMLLIILLPIVAILCLGYSIGWIQRGFQKNRNNK